MLIGHAIVTVFITMSVLRGRVQCKDEFLYTVKRIDSCDNATLANLTSEACSYYVYRRGPILTLTDLDDSAIVGWPMDRAACMTVNIEETYERMFIKVSRYYTVWDMYYQLPWVVTENGTALVSFNLDSYNIPWHPYPIQSMIFILPRKNEKIFVHLNCIKENDKKFEWGCMYFHYMNFYAEITERPNMRLTKTTTISTILPVFNYTTTVWTSPKTYVMTTVTINNLILTSVGLALFGLVFGMIISLYVFIKQ